MKDKLKSLMVERNGVDEFNKFLLGAAIVFIVSDLFARIRIIYLGGLCLIFCFYRMLSRNISQRSRENEIFLGVKEKVCLKYDKDASMKPVKYRVYVCPTCNKQIYLPANRELLIVQCPHCKNDLLKYE